MSFIQAGTSEPMAVQQNRLYPSEIKHASRKVCMKIREKPGIKTCLLTLYFKCYLKCGMHTTIE
jgi:hypothetical protein